MDLWTCDLYDESTFSVVETHIVQSSSKPSEEDLNRLYLNEDPDRMWNVASFTPDIL